MGRIKRYLATALFILAASLFFFTSVEASVGQATAKDLQTVMRTIGFLENPAGKNSVMAVIYDARFNESTRNARQIKAMLQEQHRMNVSLVPVSDLGGLRDADYAFITNGLAPYFDTISEALINYEVLSFTVDRDCMDMNCCAVFVNSRNRVEIIINKALADMAKARFKQVFLMLVTVI